MSRFHCRARPPARGWAPAPGREACARAAARRRGGGGWQARRPPSCPSRSARSQAGRALRGGGEWPGPGWGSARDIPRSGRSPAAPGGAAILRMSLQLPFRPVGVRYRGVVSVITERRTGETVSVTAAPTWSLACSPLPRRKPPGCASARRGVGCLHRWRATGFLATPVLARFSPSARDILQPLEPTEAPHGPHHGRGLSRSR